VDDARRDPTTPEHLDTITAAIEGAAQAPYAIIVSRSVATRCAAARRLRLDEPPEPGSDRLRLYGVDVVAFPGVPRTEVVMVRDAEQLAAYAELRDQGASHREAIARAILRVRDDRAFEPTEPMHDPTDEPFFSTESEWSHGNR
jgi:hypothetical protein